MLIRNTILGDGQLATKYASGAPCELRDASVDTGLWSNLWRKSATLAEIRCVFSSVLRFFDSASALWGRRRQQLAELVDTHPGGPVAEGFVGPI